MDHELRRAFSHPIRASILGILAQGAATPARLAAAIDDRLTRTCYHAAVLRKIGLIKAIGHGDGPEKAEKSYELVSPIAFAQLEDVDIPPFAQGFVSASTLRKILDKGVAALEAGTLDAREDSHFTCLSVTVDEPGLQDVNEIIDETLKRIAVALSTSSRRIAGSGAKPIPITIVVASFESPRRPEEGSDAGGQ